jgi:hypothetical protein
MENGNEKWSVELLQRDGLIGSGIPGGEVLGRNSLFMGRRRETLIYKWFGQSYQNIFIVPER